MSIFYHIKWMFADISFYISERKLFKNEDPELVTLLWKNIWSNEKRRIHDDIYKLKCAIQEWKNRYNPEYGFGRVFYEIYSNPEQYQIDTSLKEYIKASKIIKKMNRYKKRHMKKNVVYDENHSTTS